MPEIKKYSTKDELLAADKKYDHKTSVVGKSALTFPGYINSTRTQMFTSHLNQFLDVLTPEFPYMFTGAENVVGKHSTGYKEVKHDSIVYRKIMKFDDIIESPLEGYVFLYDKKKNKYSVIHRTENEDLVEDYSFRYNNERIDEVVEGEELPKGDILCKASAYDESMNYRYGRNATVMYVLDPYTSEDAAVIAESFSKAMSAVKEKTIEAGMNLNDIPLNLYGDEEHYKVFPDVGEYCKSAIFATRTLFNDQVFFDLKDDSLRSTKDFDREYYTLGAGSRIVDITIFCNNEDFPKNSFTKQIRRYKKSQEKFYKAIMETCQEIINSGEDYTKEIDDLYVRARDFIDETTKWVDSGDHCFGNIKIDFKIEKVTPLGVGGKFTGRMGNKSVVSRIVPDEDMPITDTGKRVLVKLNLLAIINRTTGYVPHELYSTFVLDRAREKMAEMTKLKDQEKFLFQIIDDFNHRQAEAMHDHYKTLSTSEKKDYISDCIYEGIHIEQVPIWEDKPIFEVLHDMYLKYDWLKPYTIYQRKWGRKYETLTKSIVGEMYMFRLKQTSEKGFSARNQGAVNMKGLPERSYKNRNNTDISSDTAIRSGEFETLTLNTAMDPEELALWHCFYRTSPKARKDMAKSIYKNESVLQIDDAYDIRTAQLFAVIFKSLSFKIDFVDSDEEIRSLDSIIMKEQRWDGKVYIMTDYDFYMMKVKEEITEKIKEEYPIITKPELDQKVEDMMDTTRRLIGNKK